jgi:hypothetical protein
VFRRLDGIAVAPNFAGGYTFFNKKGNKNSELGTGFFVHKEIIPAAKRDDFVSDRMSNWCSIIVLKVYAQQKIKLMM